MYKAKRILALIPARGGSKGVPKKNIKLIGGHPLIAYTIHSALNSRYIDDVVVTTDSAEISKIAIQYGALVPFLRPANLAEDSSRTIDAVVHALDTLRKLGYSHDSLVLLQPTSPLRRSCEIDEAIETYYNHGEFGLASVSKVVENPILTRTIDSSGILHPLLPISSTVRRQDMPSYYHVDGAMYINSIDSIDYDTSFNDNPIAYVMPQDRSIDIDCIEDFRKAELLISEFGDDCCI